MSENEQVQATPVVEDDPIEVRKAKRQALLDAGRDPYGHAFTTTDHVADLDARYADLREFADAMP